LIARKSGMPVYVAAERYDAGRLAEQQFIQQGGGLSADQVPSVFILDDGFQHRQLNREIDILLVNRVDWHDHLLPAGNLREPQSAANRANILAIPASEPEFDAELRSWGWTGPLWRLHRRIEIPQIAGPVVAFCGIARPEQFFAGLRSAGLSLVAEIVFADHHRYAASDMVNLIASARRKGAMALITTEKDEIRLRNLTSAFPVELPLEVARLSVEIEDEQNAVVTLEKLLSSTRLAQSHRRVSQR
jgi:tetraacyldisaccharide 4'-kinase